MADNPRELVRAAQSAELQGDVGRAVELLQRAAALYRDAGNAPRALQLLRHARRLDGSRVDIAEEVNRLEWMPETLLARTSPDDEDAKLASELERSLENAPLPELARRQQLIEEALRAAGGNDEESEPSRETQTWVIETEVAEDLQRLEAQLARVAASVDPGQLTGGAEVSVVETVAATLVEPEARGASHENAGAPSAPVTRNPQLFMEGDVAEAAATDEAAPPRGREQGLGLEGGVAEASPADDVAPRRRREQRLIERGPTRADVALDAWCSFCCRPRAEVGDLVAGPAGAFICKGCLTESVSLLGDVASVPRPVRSRPVEPPGAVMELVGQAEARDLLEAALQAGVRCLLAVGPEGCGKSVLFQQLQRQGRAVPATVAALSQASTSLPLLLEDVDRLDAEAQSTLAAFLTRHPEAIVLLSARGLCAETRGPVLRKDSVRLPVPTTAALTQAVRGAVPASLLEHVQFLLPLHAPTQADYVEIARRRLALRSPAVSLSEDVLAAFAAEAVRSPRAGHELHALLNRVPAGTWELDVAVKPATSRPSKGRRKGTP